MPEDATPGGDATGRDALDGVTKEHFEDLETMPNLSSHLRGKVVVMLSSQLNGVFGT
jgi:hypothetical protein